MAEPVDEAGRADRELRQAGLSLDVSGAVATLTLARPERRNALTVATWHAMARIGDTLPDDVRVVVVRGEGPSFSSGIDLSTFSGQSDTTIDEDYVAGLQAAYMWLRRPEIVSIAAVHGHAIGAGFQLALACDLCIAAGDAKFCMKEAAFGLVPDLTGTKPLVDIVGVARALELCLTARTVAADEAARLGLAQLVVPRAELDAAVSDLAAAIVQVRPDTAAAVKRLIRQAPGNDLETQAAAERREQVVLLRRLLGTESS